jgi:hypothetical protein
MLLVGVTAQAQNVTVGLLGGMEATYTRDGQVVSVKDNIVTVEDKSGFLWELETDELKEGQEVVLKMNDNNTDGIITDDIIIDYKINRKFITYLATKVRIVKLFQVDETNSKDKVRIFIICRASNYWQVIFDKTYDLTEKYTTFVKDFKECTF